MTFYLVQPWGRDRYRQATVQSIHDTVEDAYARLDAIAEKLQRDGAPPDYLELYVVDEQRQPVVCQACAVTLTPIERRRQSLFAFRRHAGRTSAAYPM